MGLVTTAWVPMGAQAPGLSPNNHPNPSQKRQELGPTPDTRHDDAIRRHRVEVRNRGDTPHQGGVNFFKRAPYTPCPSLALLCQHRGRAGSFACSFDNPALNRSSKIFATTLSSPLPKAFMTFPHPTSQSFASTPPEAPCNRSHQQS